MTMPEGLLVDLDDTLYDYRSAHEPSMDRVRAECETRLKIPAGEFESAFRRARGMIHAELDGTAASHNRLLYFQRMLELLGVPALEHARSLSELYWNSFLERMRLRPGALEFLNLFSPEAICIVTDLTADIQFRKLEKLDLARRIRFMVTSEEAGIEKPAADMFHAGLRKLGMTPDQVCMVGDNYEKDVVGAAALGIQACWLNARETPDEPAHGARAELEHAPTGKMPARRTPTKAPLEVSSFAQLTEALRS